MRHCRNDHQISSSGMLLVVTLLGGLQIVQMAKPACKEHELKRRKMKYHATPPHDPKSSTSHTMDIIVAPYARNSGKCWHRAFTCGGRRRGTGPAGSRSRTSTHVGQCES